MKKQLEKPILAEGEVTGHAHRLPVGTAVIEDPDTGLREFDMAEPGELTHEEHGTVRVPAGLHVSGKVREFDHPSEAARNVQD
jgi:hypothetical protein